jgi:ABC-2 type transport system ATP-binding protein
VPTDAAPAIDVRGLNKNFGAKHVVRDLSLLVNRGEIYAFLGPNGSGTCLGFDVIRETYAIKREVGYMTQRFSLWEDLTIRENLDFVARMYQVPDRRAAVRRAVDELGLGPRRDQVAGELSGGWKQRLALAACMLHRPQLLLLDEPTAGVDPMARREFWDHIHDLAASGIAVLVSTHYMDEAERCHRLAYIFEGRLLATGTAADVVRAERLAGMAVHGPNLAALADALRGFAGVEQVTMFGETLHVTGHDASLLEQAMRACSADPAQRWAPIEPGLEDVFISLMSHAPRDAR